MVVLKCFDKIFFILEYVNINNKIVFFIMRMLFYVCIYVEKYN